MDMIINEDALSTLEGAGSCLKCRYLLPRLVESAPVYFTQGFVRCGHCGDRVDLWQAALDRAIHLRFHGALALVSFGAVQTSFVIQVEAWKVCEVELTKRGVPDDARILRRIYTGQSGDMSVLEWHSNAPPLRFPGTVLRLLGIPFGETTVSGPRPVGINVVWIRREESDEWSYLVTAFEAAAVGDFAPSLVFAQSTVETSMMPLIEERFRRHASTERVKNFMRGALTYGYALNVVLPYLCAETQVARMPDALRGSLNKMREKRNDIIHEGAKAAAVTAEDAMEGLCAAAFGFEYMRFVRPNLERT
jgi:hypothetical protein